MKNYIFSNESLSNQKSLKIIKLQMKAQEGEYVLLDMLCQHEIFDERLIRLEHEGKCVFKGEMLDFPLYKEPGFMRVRYVAKAPFEENGEGWRLPYCDPVSHEVGYFNLDYKGSKSKDLVKVLKGDFVVKRIRQPLETIKVVFQRKTEVLLDVMPYVKRAFLGKEIETFTGLHFHKGLAKLKTKAKEGVRFDFGKPFHLPLYEVTGECFMPFKAKEEIEIYLKWKGNGYDVVDYCVPDELIVLELEDFSETRVKRAFNKVIFKGYQSHQSEMVDIKIPFDPDLRLGQVVYAQSYLGRVSKIVATDTVMQVSLVLIKKYGFETKIPEFKVQKKVMEPEVSVINCAEVQRDKLRGVQNLEDMRAILSAHKTKVIIKYSR